MANESVSNAVGERFKVHTVCASNQNRSMAAHQEIHLRGYQVKSYGTGKEVKLPGPSAMEPQVFAFNTPYEEMMNELRRRDEALYMSNGVLAMLERNAKIKRAPEQWREARERADLVLTFEERIFDAVLEDFLTARAPSAFAPAYIVNLETRDTHADAGVVAKVAAELVEAMAGAQNLDAEIDDIAAIFEAKTGRAIMVAPVFY